MPVTIQSGKHQATFGNNNTYRWTSANPRLEAFLNSTIPLEQLSPSVGQPDLFVARDAVARLGDGATIIAISPETMPAGTVF